MQSNSILIFGSLLLVLFLSFLIYISVFPWLSKRKSERSIIMHEGKSSIEEISTPNYRKIAIALDFSNKDSKVITSAIGHHGKDKEYILIHIVETATAHLHGDQTYDYESINDKIRLDELASELKQKGFSVKGILGFHNTSKEIVRIVKEEDADILFIGAHGHRGFKDFIYGSTIDRVRHHLDIPIFIVNA